jgi:CelD/BcsL family acetyltransferase involved in cellulose biosynthesis
MSLSAKSRPAVPASERAFAGEPTDVGLVSDDAAFAALERHWNAIAAQRPDLSVFGRHEWFEAAWLWQRESARLHVLTWSAHGQVRALLPMVERDGRGRLGTVRELHLLTVPDTQVCDILVAERHGTEAARAFAAYLVAHRRAWEVMRLSYLRPDSMIATRLATAMASMGCEVAKAGTPGNPFVSLGGDWTTYYAGRSRRLKKANNLAANRLAKAGDVRVSWLEPGTPDDGRVAETVENVVAISKSSWKSETGTTLDRPGPGAFIRRLSAIAATRGWLSIWTLSLNGEAAAMEYQLVYEGNVHALRSDFRIGLEEISPGSHLSRTMLERMFGRGLDRYLMGPGNNAYKYRWAEATEPQVSVTVYSPSLPGRALGAWERRLKPRLSAIRSWFDKPSPPHSSPDED